MQYKTIPREHQRIAFEFARDLRYFALFGDMGIGKTKIIIDLATWHYTRQHIRNLLVIAPNQVHNQWIDEQFPEHCAIPYSAFVWESSNVTKRYFKALDRFVRKPFDGLRVLTINIEAFQSDKVLPLATHFVRDGTTFIVLDEATKIKSIDAKRTQHMLTLRDKAGPYAIKSILTGTPTAKSPLNLWTMFEFLQRNYFGCTFTSFSHRHEITTKRLVTIKDKEVLRTLPLNDVAFKIIKATIAKYRRENNVEKLDVYAYEELGKAFYMSANDILLIDKSERPIRYKNLDLIKNKISPVTITIKKSDCKDLPPKSYVKIPLDATDEQRKLIRELSKYAYAMYEGKEIIVQQKIVLATRIMQICGGFFSYRDDMKTLLTGKPQYESLPLVGDNPKLSFLLSDIEQLGEDEQFIVWSVFKPELRMLQRELAAAGTVCGIHGDVTAAQRTDSIEGFKSGRYRICVANPASAGFGLNFQNAPTQYYYSRNYNVEERLQAEDRSHRLTSTLPVTYKDLFYKGTYETRVLQAISDGQDMNSFFMSSSLADIFATPTKGAFLDD